MLKIISWNVNGFRSILKKGFLADVLEKDYDIICFQEVKLSNLENIRRVVPTHYHIYGNITSNSRNGVLVLSKKKAISVEYKIDHKEFDNQGRYIKIDFPDFTLINLYMPHGGRDKSKLPFKIEVAKTIEQNLKQIVNRRVIIATDFNIARDDIDVCRANHNHNNIMFTDGERAIVNNILNIGYKDIYRELNPQKQKYTWWSYAFECRNRNIGWRIDYFFVSEKLMPNISSIHILTEQIGSDHCPIMIELEDTVNG